MACLAEWAWPVVAIVAILVFRAPLSHMIDRGRKLSVKIPKDGEVVLEADEARSIAAAMVREVDDLLEGLTPEQKTLYLEIANRSEGAPLPVPEGFRRNEDKLHFDLRELRSRHLIRPAEGGTWKTGKHAQLTPFGGLVLKIRADQLRSSVAG